MVRSPRWRLNADHMTLELAGMAAASAERFGRGVAVQIVFRSSEAAAALLQAPPAVQVFEPAPMPPLGPVAPRVDAWIDEAAREAKEAAEARRTGKEIALSRLGTGPRDDERGLPGFRRRR